MEPMEAQQHSQSRLHADLHAIRLIGIHEDRNPFV